MGKRAELLALRRMAAAELVRALGPAGGYAPGPAFGVRQERFSQLARGEVDRFSLEWLLERVYRMGGEVELEIRLGDVTRAWSLARARRRVAPVSLPYTSPVPVMPLGETPGRRGGQTSRRDR